MKKAAVCLVCLFCLCLCGCDKKNAAPEATQTPAPIGLDLFGSGQEGELSRILSSALTPYEDILTRVAMSGCGTADYAIPGQILSQAALHANEKNAQPQNGYYNFTVDLGGEFTYSVWGQDILDAMETPVPEDYDITLDDHDHMENISGDMQTEGGGIFAHRYVYDIAEDGSYGATEIWSTLDGTVTGHERFDYQIVGEYFYFTDAVLDTMNSTPEGYLYIITEGVITPTEMTLCEYSETAPVPGVPSSYPLLNSLDAGSMLSKPDLTMTLHAKGDTLTEKLNGTTGTYSLK